MVSREYSPTLHGILRRFSHYGMVSIPPYMIYSPTIVSCVYSPTLHTCGHGHRETNMREGSHELLVRCCNETLLVGLDLCPQVRARYFGQEEGAGVCVYIYVYGNIFVS